MGMSIDEYTEIKRQQECVSKTIDILWKMAQKYQKIEQIYSDYLDDMDAEKLADKLGEVF